MRGDAVAVLVWALWLGVLASVLAVWTDDPLPPGLLGISAVAAVVLGLGLAARQPARNRSRRVPDLSLSVLILVVGMVLLLNALLLGAWLAYVGATALIAGVGGVARELLAARRAG